MPNSTILPAASAYIANLTSISKILRISDSDSNSHYTILINAYTNLAISVEESENLLLAYYNFLPQSLKTVFAETTRGGEDLLDMVLGYFDGLVGVGDHGGLGLVAESKFSASKMTLLGGGGSRDLAGKGGLWDEERLVLETGKAVMQRDALEFLLTSGTCALIRQSFTLLYNQTLGASPSREKSLVVTSESQTLPRRRPVPSSPTNLQNAIPSTQASLSPQINPLRPKATVSMEPAFRHPQTRKTVFHLLQTPSLHLFLSNKSSNKLSLPGTYTPSDQEYPVPELTYKKFQRIQTRFWNSILDAIETEIEDLASQSFDTNAEAQPGNMELRGLLARLDDVSDAQRALEAELGGMRI